MTTDMNSRLRNGARHGDVSYISLALSDLDRGRTFYGAVLGWQFSPGTSEHGAQVDDVVPMIGLWDGEQSGGGRVHGAVLAYRVNDIASAVAVVRQQGGTIGDPHLEPYAMAAEGSDDQGIPFFLHELPTADGAAPQNGELAGDVSYLVMVVPDLDAAQRFYRGLFGAGGADVSDVSPQIGMTSYLEARPAHPGVILCYRVEDLADALTRVRGAGGRAGTATQRPYGLEAHCADDQGTQFYLHEF